MSKMLGKITISIWTATDPASTNPTKDHHDFTLEIGPGWVCIGGGTRGRSGPFAGNFLTKSAPTLGTDGKPNFMGWSVVTRDHLFILLLQWLVMPLSSFVGCSISRSQNKT